ncbi:MAG: bacillithiol biosynthesis deacetylase BshB1 [Bacteroidia bacterium]|nr:bacillithiol biosynthesis deacetylase BshB1 [Bacteroidia bacterium]MDW8158807.1 bacillithiol biosynthesis deacetylase BshB1 [Bacteroidia bacterium]
MELDVLAIVAHPDDAELGCGGTLLKLKSEGKKTGIVDLTPGQMGTRGTVALRQQEAEAAKEILQLDLRCNLGLQDVFFSNTPEQQLPVIEIIRQTRPKVVITNAPIDRHPDHGKAAQLVRDACFYSGLAKLKTQYPAYRPSKIFYMIQDQYLEPSFVIDITSFYEQKLKAILAFASQFYNPHSTEPETLISSKRYLHLIEARARHFGHYIGTEFGEGFIHTQPLKVHSLLDLVN